MDILASHEVTKEKAKTVESYSTIRKDAEDMLDLLDAGIERDGMLVGAVALSHCQVSKDPFNFFVADRQYRDLLGGHRVFVNPKIIDQKEIVPFVEGCLTFHGRKHIDTQRFRSIEVEYQYPKSDGTLKFSQRFRLEGTAAIVFQHEIDHSNGINIYDKFSL